MKITRNMLVAAMALMLVTLGACQKEDDSSVVTGGEVDGGGEVYTTELPGTVWIHYDTMDWHHDGITEKYPVGEILQFVNDSVVLEYNVDYLYDPDDWSLVFTYSYHFDGSKGEMTMVKAEDNFPFMPSPVGNVYSLKYDGNKDVLYYGFPTVEKPPLVYYRMEK